MALLTLKNISKTYYEKRKIVKQALKGVSFEIHEGEIFALLGVNGAGKTTLSSIIASLHPPTSGSIFWREKSIYEQLLAYKKAVGFCPQKPNLDKSLTVEETLLFSAKCYGFTQDKAKERLDYLLEKLGLHEYAKASSKQLSGGYKQRFLIARALMHDPKIILLDEPTVGLDPHVRRQLWAIIRELKSQGKTLLLTTHYLDEAEMLSDRVCLIHNGIIKTIESPANLKRLHQKNNLEEVFLKFVDDPEAEIFKSEMEEGEK